jgi:kumamolisin
MNKMVAWVSVIVASGLACGSKQAPGEVPGSSTAGTSCPLVSGSHMLTKARAQAATYKAAPAGGPRLKPLEGHMLAVKTAAELGAVDDSQEIPITISLPVSDQAALDQTLIDLYRPGSASYGKFLTPAEFRARFGPSDLEVDKVKSFLAAQGLTKISHEGMLVHASGSASALSAAFHTELHNYVDSKGRAFRAPRFELQIPEGLAIQGVHGLQNYSRAHTHLQAAGPGTGSHTGSGPSGGYSPADIHTAYNIPSGLDGSGQTLALLELDGYDPSDMTAYEQQFNLPAVPLQNVLVDGASGTPGGGQPEVTLDIELMVAVAPKATKIIVYEGPNSDQGILDVFGKIANDNLATSVSTSWGDSEGDVTSSFMSSENTIFQQMAAQGQTVYAASGDSGADDNGSSLGVDDPSSQPYVAGVGGTSLTIGSGGDRVSETTWNDSQGAGGGGISSVWTVPNWQQGLANGANLGSSTMRNTPDVSLHADVALGYAIYEGGSWGIWGGTSCAAPLWAGFTALVNQQRAANGLSSLGYANPALYAIGKSARYATDFFDIDDGSTNGHYPAVTGYDEATGLGTYNASNLLDDLASVTPVTSASSPTSCSGS